MLTLKNTPMADILVFIETPTFTHQLQTLITDDEYRELQTNLMINPECGKIIKGSGGVRKVRQAAKGHGKSGGIRVIYYWMSDNAQIYMLLAYPKSVQDDLSAEQTAKLYDLVKALKKSGQRTI